MRSAISFSLAVGAFALLGCADDGFEDMTCDESTCFHCPPHDACEEYRCDETHQCPMSRVCSNDNRCVPRINNGGGCDSHDDCEANEICTLEGQCVTSPGGGPDTTDAADTSEPDAGPGDVGLPDHPDDACRVSAMCGLDGACVNGGCYFACSPDHKCPPGQACTEAGCRAAPPENQCTFGGECGTDHACLEGTCYERCAETLDCSPHTRCSTGMCIADISPVLQCSGAGSCQGGRACVDGQCLLACVDGACETGFVCDLGYCARATTCFDQTQCDGHDCIDGACAFGP